MSAEDVQAFLHHVGLPPRPAIPDERFRSLAFGTWTAPPVPVEVMGGFSLATPEGWRDVWPATREAIPVSGGTVFIPSADELARLLEAFGRPKDLERARLLRAEPGSDRF